MKYDDKKFEEMNLNMEAIQDIRKYDNQPLTENEKDFIKTLE